MAQLGGRSSIARRFGFAASPARVAAIALACLVLALAGLLVRCPSGGVTVERGIANAQDAGVAEGVVGEDGAGGGAAAPDDGGESPPGGTGEPSGAAGEPRRILIHVDGAVASPGLVRLETEDARVADAIEAAGGLADGADTTALNLAARVEDGQKVHVPAEGEEPVLSGVRSAASGGTASPSGLVNLNTADAAQLQELPGIGEATAAAIIRDREQNGPFSCVEDLMRVSGIGEKKLARIESDVTV